MLVGRNRLGNRVNSVSDILPLHTGGGRPTALRLFAHLRGLDGPIRLADLGDCMRSLGLAPGMFACRTFQGTPVRQRGLDVGSFFLADKAGGVASTVMVGELPVHLRERASHPNARTGVRPPTVAHRDCGPCGPTYP